MKQFCGAAGIFLSAFLVGCSGGTATSSQSQGSTGSASGSGSQNPPAPLNFAGSWQFTAASTKHQGFNTLVEANLQQSGSILNATGANQILIIAENPSGPAIVGGNCSGSGNASLSGSIVSGTVLSMTLDEGGAIFAIDANASADGKTMTGTYEIVNGSCADSGTFTGALVQSLSGTYSGPLMFPDGTTDTVSANLTVGSSSLSANVQVSGVDNGSLTMTGTDIGDAFSLSGTFQGFALAYYGYHDATSDSINVYDPVTGQHLGTLRQGENLPGPTATTPTFVQSATFTNQLTSTGSTASAIFANQANAGDLIAVAFWSINPDNSCNVPVSDSAGNVYRLVSGTSPADADAAIVCVYAAANVTGGRNLEVTVKPGYQLNLGFALAAMEYSGVSAVDTASARSDGSQGTIGSAVTSGPVLTHYPSELVLGVVIGDAKFQTGAGFTSRFASNYFLVEDKFVQTAGNYEADFSNPQSAQGVFWDAAMATFH